MTLPDWMSTLGEPRTTPLALKAAAAPPELAAWHALLSQRNFEKVRSWRLRESFAQTGSDVLTSSIDLVAKLTGTVPLAISRGGHEKAVVSLAPLDGDQASVFEWSEEDAGMERVAASISQWLYDAWSAEEEDASRVASVKRPAPKKQSLPAHWNPEKLLKRSRWLLIALEQDPWNDLEPEDALKDAPKVKAFAEEAKLLPECPHLAAYWVWALFLLDHHDVLKAALPKFLEHADPFVQESARAFRAVLEGKETNGALGPVHDEDTLEALRVEVVESAPKKLRGPGPLLDRPAKKSAGGEAAALKAARKWMKRQYGDLDRELFWGLVETDSPSPEVRQFVVESLEVCKHPDPIDPLALAALKWKLGETVGALRRCITERLGFAKPAYGVLHCFGAVRAVRAVAALGAEDTLPFLQAELERTLSSGLQPPYLNVDVTALAAGILYRDPSDARALDLAHRVIAIEVGKIEKGVIPSHAQPVLVAAIVWAAEMKGIRALFEAMRPFLNARANSEDDAFYGMLREAIQEGLR